MLPESWPTTFSLLQQSLLLATTDSGPPKIVGDENECDRQSCSDKKEPVEMKAHKVRVYPTKEQTKLLNKWIGTSRWTYNQAVACIRKKSCKANKKALRAHLINIPSLQGTEHEWALETPYDIRDEAMADVLKAIKANFAAKREKFHLKFRSRKDDHQSIVVLKKHWNHKRGR